MYQKNQAADMELPEENLGGVVKQMSVNLEQALARFWRRIRIFFALLHSLVARMTALA